MKVTDLMKLIKKETNIFVGRIGDTYYISDTNWMIGVTEMFYTEFAIKYSAKYMDHEIPIKLEDNEFYNKRRYSTFSKSDKNVFESLLTKVPTNEVLLTDFYVKVKDKKQGRLIKVNNAVSVINADYEVLLEGADEYRGTDILGAVYGLKEGKIVSIVMPIRYPDLAIEIQKQLLGRSL